MTKMKRGILVERGRKIAKSQGKKDVEKVATKTH